MPATKKKLGRVKTGRSKPKPQTFGGTTEFLRALPEVLRLHRDGQYTDEELRLARYWFLKGFTAASECFCQGNEFVYDKISGDIDDSIKFLRGQYGKNLGATGNHKSKPKK